MTNTAANAARDRIQDAIQFRRWGHGYFMPNLLVDRDALRLLKIEYRPTKDPDEIHRQIGGLATLQFIEPGETE